MVPIYRGSNRSNSKNKEISINIIFMVQPCIFWDGRVTTCCVDYQGKGIIGNIKEESFAKIWQERQVAKNKNAHLEKNNTIVFLVFKLSILEMRGKYREVVKEDNLSPKRWKSW